MTKDSDLGNSVNQRSGQRRIAIVIAVFVAWAVVAPLLTNSLHELAPSGDKESFGSSIKSETPSTEPGVRLRLSTTKPAEPTTPAKPAVAPGVPLGEEATREVLSRFTPFTTSSDSKPTWNAPAESLLPPRSGITEMAAFPIDGASGEKVDEIPNVRLEVLRATPTGHVSVAPFLAITFNQPMVDLATLDQLDQQEPPARISPAIEGTWHWLGTNTVRFSPSPEIGGETLDRFPGATKYQVIVPAGTKSVSGSELEDEFSFTFETPALGVNSVSGFTTTPAPRDLSPWDVPTYLPPQPTIVVTFDQVIDPDSAVQHLGIEAGGKTYSLRAATAQEIDSDGTATLALKAALPSRALAVVPVDPLPLDQRVTLEIGAGLTSAEGNDVPSINHTFHARTYPPLQVKRASCNAERQCRPGDTFVIETSTQIDPTTFNPAEIQVKPALVDAVVAAEGNRVLILGATEAKTTYTVTLSAGLTDIYGQTLGGAVSNTLSVGTSAPAIYGLDQPLITLDPLSPKAEVQFQTRGHESLRVQLFKVQPNDWSKYQEFQYEWLWRDDASIPFTEIADFTTNLDISNGKLVTATIDLEKYLPSTGHVVALVTPTKRFGPNDENYWDNRPRLVWLQRTNIGLDVVINNSQPVLWATALDTGEPLDGVDISGGGAIALGATNTEGIARITPTSHTNFLVGTLNDDSVIVDDLYLSSDGTWANTDELRWYTFDDRSLYTPGETVNVKGWVRKLAISGDAQLHLSSGGSVAFTAQDIFGNTIAEGTTDLSVLGGFDLSFEVPMGANLGTAWVVLFLDGEPELANSSYAHPFEIAEFRRPDFEVKTEANSVAPHLVNEPLEFSLTATYLGGGALPQAPVDWEVSATTGQYSPPDWDDYTFGIWRPWWGENLGFRGAFMPLVESGFAGATLTMGSWPQPIDQQIETLQDFTDGYGGAGLRVELEGDNDGQPLVMNTVGTVEDVNRQRLSSATQTLVHSGAYYVGLAQKQLFTSVDEEFSVGFVVTDIDGQVASGYDVAFRLERLERRWSNGEWSEEGVDPQEQTLVSGAEANNVGFVATKGGKYRLSATVVDSSGNYTRTEITHWVKGATEPDTFGPRDAEKLELVPNARNYTDGDTAEILVQAPLEASNGLYLINRAGVREVHDFTLTNGTATIEIPIKDTAVPGFTLFVTVAGTKSELINATSEDATSTNVPAWANGSIYISVPPTNRELTVEVTPAARTYNPGEAAHIEVKVTDSLGAPVDNAEVAIVVVDEAVLALTNYAPINPIESFYQPFGDYLEAVSSRQSLRSNHPADITRLDNISDEKANESAAGFSTASRNSPFDDSARDEEATGGSQTTLSVTRSNFEALALFSPQLHTNQEGYAEVGFKLPDTLTRYRIIARVADGPENFGLGENTLTASKMLQVRPSAPRFLNFGDEFELPFVLVNQTSKVLATSIVLETDNLEILGSAGLSVEVPPSDHVEVRFPVRTVSAGSAGFRLSASTDEFSDSVAVTLPVYTPATAEAFATYGVLDDGAVATTIRSPEHIFSEFGGLEVTTSSTALAALSDAVISLTNYPFDHSDALASRVLSIVALRDVLDAFASPNLPASDALNQTVEADLARLAMQQNADGGFPVWRRDEPSDPYRSVQVVHAFVAAKKAGYNLNTRVLDDGMVYLENIENNIPSDWDRQARVSVTAYALWVRTLSGAQVTSEATSLYNKYESDFSLEALAWIWPLVESSQATEISRVVHNKVVETPGAATFTSAYDEGEYLVLSSQTRANAIILDALIRLEPTSDIIPKVVNALVGNQRNPQGHWGSVQENSFVLLALKSYFDAYEAQAPDFVANMWLGDTYIGTNAWSGYTTKSVLTNIPMVNLLQLTTTPSPDSPNISNTSGQDTAAVPLVLSKNGVGRLYYRLGLRYAPRSLQLAPRDEGFVVSRSYEAVDDPDDVRQNDDGTWQVKAGTNVAVRVTMVAESDRRNMVLIDPLPAGFEIINPNFANTPHVELPKDPESEEYPSSLLYRSLWWFDHTNQRNDRAEVFSAYLGAGVYEYRYLARATTPGAFVVPPARAEELYSPEVFGRSGSTTVNIVASE